MIDIHTIQKKLESQDIPVPADLSASTFDASNSTDDTFAEDLDTFLANNNQKVHSYVRLLQEKLTLEQEIANYRAAKTELQEEQNQAASFEDSIEEKESTLSAVLSLQKRKTQLQVELQKFGDMAMDENLGSKTTQIKVGRLQQIINQLVSIRNVVVESVQAAVSGENKEKPQREFQPIVLILLLHLFAIILFYLLTFSVSLLLFGGITFLFNLGFLLVYKLANNLQPLEMTQQDIQKLTYDKLSPRNPNEDSFLVNAAWVHALKDELHDIEHEIRNRLGGKTYETAEHELVQLQKQQEGFSNTAKSRPVLTAEEYLQKRRELDIIGIEIEEIEETMPDMFILANIDNSLKYNKLLQTLTSNPLFVQVAKV